MSDSLAALIRRHNARQLEAMLTKEEALRWAEGWYEEHGRRWPTRRFRVEAGPLRSHLLEEGPARAAAAKHNGRVVELIPTRTAYNERKARDAQDQEEET